MAKKSGCLVKKHITIVDIKAGDVFFNDPGDKFAIVLRSWNTYYNENSWYLAGFKNTLEPYSDFGTGDIKQNVINHLNKNRWVFVKNINPEIKDLLIKK